MGMTKPIFITWKRYGFRHIVEDEKTGGYLDYRRTPMHFTEGKAICGNKYWTVDYVNEEDIPSWHGTYDPRDTRRPLCGACRKKWKKLHGEELS